MVMDLGDGRDARSCLFEGAFHFSRLRTPGLDADDSDDGGEAVFDAMAHLARQQRLVFQRLLEPGIRMMTLDCNSGQPGEADQEVGVRLIEPTGMGTSTSSTPKNVSLCPPRSISTSIARLTP